MNINAISRAVQNILSSVDQLGNVGAAAAAAASSDGPPSETTIFPGGRDTMPFLIQQGNACGTTSLAMIMSYLKGHPYTQHDIDHQIRRMDVFTSPQDLVKYARGQGLNAELYNRGNLDELKRFIDLGIPCQALIGLGASNALARMHYVDVVGYGVQGGEDVVLLHDPNHVDLQKMPVQDFLKAWQAPPAGFENFFIAYAQPGSSLPPGRDSGIEGTLTAAQGIANLLNGIDRIGHSRETPGALFRGLRQVEAGISQTVGGGVNAGIQLASEWLRDNVRYRRS